MNIVCLINVYVFGGVSRSIARCMKLSEEFAVEKRVSSSCVNESPNVEDVCSVHVHEQSVLCVRFASRPGFVPTALTIYLLKCFIAESCSSTSVPRSTLMGVSRVEHSRFA